MAIAQRIPFNDPGALGFFGVNGWTHSIAFKGPGLMSIVEPGISAFKESGGVRSSIGPSGIVRADARIPGNILHKYLRIEPADIGRLELASLQRRDTKACINDTVASVLAAVYFGMGENAGRADALGLSSTYAVALNGSVEIGLKIHPESFIEAFNVRTPNTRSPNTLSQIASAVALAGELSRVSALAEKIAPRNTKPRTHPDGLSYPGLY